MAPDSLLPGTIFLSGILVTEAPPALSQIFPSIPFSFYSGRLLCYT